MPGLDSSARELARPLAGQWSDSKRVRVRAQAVKEFQRLDGDEARHAFLAEPPLAGDVVWDAALAAPAVHLRRMVGIVKTPAWTREPERYSPRLA